MSGGRVIEVGYHLIDKERIFDIGQSIHANRQRIMKSGGGKIRTYTQMLRKMLRQSVMFFVLALVQAGLLWVSEATGVKIVLLVLCVLFGGFMLAVWRTHRRLYDRTLALYLANNGETGRILFDESGMVESGESGEETEIGWEEYVACVMSEETIVILSTRPVMLILSRTGGTEQGIRQALETFGRSESIYQVDVRERR